MWPNKCILCISHGSYLLLPEPMDLYFANAECSQNFILPNGQIRQKWQLTECSHFLILQYNVTGISEPIPWHSLVQSSALSQMIKICNAIYHTQVDQRKNRFAPTHLPSSHLPPSMLSAIPSNAHREQAIPLSTLLLFSGRQVLRVLTDGRHVV